MGNEDNLTDPEFWESFQAQLDYRDPRDHGRRMIQATLATDEQISQWTKDGPLVTIRTNDDDSQEGEQ